MKIDKKYYVAEVMRNRNESIYWSACNKGLAASVFNEVKKQLPAARYYEYGGLQIKTTNEQQERTLLNLVETEKDICEMRLNEIEALRRQITGEDEDV